MVTVVATTVSSVSATASDVGVQGTVLATPVSGLVSQATVSCPDTGEYVLQLRLVSRRIVRYRQTVVQAVDLRDWYVVADYAARLVSLMAERAAYVRVLRVRLRPERVYADCPF